MQPRMPKCSAAIDRHGRQQFLRLGIEGVGRECVGDDRTHQLPSLHHRRGQHRVGSRQLAECVVDRTARHGVGGIRAGGPPGFAAPDRIGENAALDVQVEERAITVRRGVAAREEL